MLILGLACGIFICLVIGTIGIYILRRGKLIACIDDESQTYLYLKLNKPINKQTRARYLLFNLVKIDSKFYNDGPRE